MHEMSIILKTRQYHIKQFGLKFYQNNHMTCSSGFFVCLYQWRGVLFCVCIIHHFFMS